MSTLISGYSEYDKLPSNDGLIDLEQIEYEAFFPQVTQYIPNAVRFILRDVVRNACIEFCERTYYWQKSVFMPVEVGKSAYTLDLPEQTKLIGINQIYFGEYLLIPRSPDELASIYILGDWQARTGNPQYYVRLTRPEFLIVPYLNFPPADNLNELHVRYSLAPTRSSTLIAKDIFEQWAEIIGHGARARLHAQTKQPYSDKAMAQEEMRLFRTGINEVRIMMNKGFDRTSTRTEFQNFV